MGYKLAGCDVIGCNEIDPRMNAVYIKNHHPKHNFLMDIRAFNDLPELPDELYHLDILDGSPPCTTFSMAGERAESWGKSKKFREGQAEQTLDDLSFVFIDTVNRLKPRCVIMENVEGLIKGEAWTYVQRIYAKFTEIGYTVRHWLLKGEEMGIPQSRHRVFFIALRNDVPFKVSDINMAFDYEQIPFGEIKSKEYVPVSEKVNELLSEATPEDKALSDIILRHSGKWSRFNEKIVWDEQVCCTIQAHGMYRGNDKSKFATDDYRNAQTFAQDYIFESTAEAAYICGMSVPPVMIKRIVTRLIEQGVFNERAE